MKCGLKEMWWNMNNEVVNATQVLIFRNWITARKFCQSVFFTALNVSCDQNIYLVKSSFKIASHAISYQDPHFV